MQPFDNSPEEVLYAEMMTIFEEHMFDTYEEFQEMLLEVPGANGCSQEFIDEQYDGDIFAWQEDNNSNSGCYDCKECTDCENCTNCFCCKNCINSVNCINSTDCINCKDCNSCSNCQHCSSCSNLKNEELKEN